MRKDKFIDNILFIYFMLFIVVGYLMIKFLKIDSKIIFYYIFPVSAFLSNLLSSFKGRWLKYLLPILYGVGGIVLPMMVLNSGYNPFSLYYGLIPSIVGFMVGTFLKMLENIRYNKKHYNYSKKKNKK